MPYVFKSLNTEDCLNSRKYIKFNKLLEQIAKELNGYLTEDGIIIIAQSWSDAYFLMIGRAFERQGLYINLERYFPHDVTKEHFAVVFSKQKSISEIPDLPLSLATMMNLGLYDLKFYGVTAESIKKLFVIDKPVFSTTREVEGTDIKALDEIFEREGLALLYRSGSDGTRRAIIMSAAQLKEQIKMCSNTRKIKLGPPL